MSWNDISKANYFEVQFAYIEDEEYIKDDCYVATDTYELDTEEVASAIANELLSADAIFVHVTKIEKRFLNLSLSKHIN